VLALATAALLLKETADAKNDPDPWASRSGFRVNQPYSRALPLETALGPCDVRVMYSGDRHHLTASGVTQPFTFVTTPDGDLRIKFGDLAAIGTVFFNGDHMHVFTEGLETVLNVKDPLAQATADEGRGGLVAPMPGKIVSVLAQVGTPVKKGTGLLVMEAMKMEHTISAPADGSVTSFLYRPGDQVAEGSALLEFAATVKGA
jgi:3-methylcrotonyl-CoA carboxylase alpha subunit